MKKPRQIRQPYALDAQFVIQYYFPHAQMRGYNSHNITYTAGTSSGLVVGFLMQLTNYGKTVVYGREKRKHFIRYLHAQVNTWSTPEDVGFYTLPRQIKSLFGCSKGKPTLEFV